LGHILVIIHSKNHQAPAGGQGDRPQENSPGIADFIDSALYRKVNTLLLHHLLEVVNRDYAKLVFGGRPLKIAVDFIDIPFHTPN
jgi:hypothetical protein